MSQSILILREMCDRSLKYGDLCFLAMEEAVALEEVEHDGDTDITDTDAEADGELILVRKFSSEPIVVMDIAAEVVGEVIIGLWMTASEEELTSPLPLLPSPVVAGPVITDAGSVIAFVSVVVVAAMLCGLFDIEVILVFIIGMLISFAGFCFCFFFA